MARLTPTGIASLAVLAGALVFGVVLGFVLAFGSSEADPWDERWADLGVEEVEFVFLGDLTAREQKSIRAELRSAQVVFAEHFGAVTSDFTVYVSTDLEGLNERLAVDLGADARVWFRCGGIAFPGGVAIALEDCTPEDRAIGGPLAHEYFHILQSRTSLGSVGTANAGAFPRSLMLQLVEGSAVYASAVHRESRGRWTLDARIEGARLSWAELGANPSFSELDRWRQASFIYDGGLLAAEWLVRRAGPQAMLKFFHTGAHRAAFQSAFGLSVDAFRNAFEAYLREVAPPFEWRNAGIVLDANEVPAEGMTVGASVRIAGEPWVAGMATTGDSGAFEFMGPGGGHTLLVGLQCPDIDGTWGSVVFVGEFGSDGFVADDDGFYEAGDRGAAPFKGEYRNRTDLVIRIPTTRAALTTEHCES